MVDSPAGRPEPTAERRGLTRNPKVLAYWRTRCALTCSAVERANLEAVRGEGVRWLKVPRELHQLLHDICDTTDAVSGVIEWARKHRGGPAVALELEAAGLYRERGGIQHDDWSCPRARRKVAFLTVLLMAPFEMPRRVMCGGGESDEVVRVTAGVPETLLITMLRSGQREPYCVRTLQRDMAEIEASTDLMQRWRTPAAHAQPWEHTGEHGVLNRYSVRVGLVREQWRRCRDGFEAAVKAFALRSASWIAWFPARPRGEPVRWDRGGRLLPEPAT